MKKHGFETLLYSTLGVAALFLVAVAINFIVGQFNSRADLTAEHLYTLSDGTKAILKKIDGPLEVRLYVTQGENEMPVQFKAYAQRVEDLLKEYRKVSKGKITVKKLDPKPDSDAEDSANLDGIEGQPTQTGERIYLGVAVSYADAKSAVPFLPPNKENLLEYEISRAVSQVIANEKKVLGVMTSLPVFGQQANPMMARMGQQPRDALVFISELQRDFTVKQVAMDVDKIDDDIKELLVIHPKDISDKAQYALDQFLMRGGKLIALLDPLNVMDPTARQNPMMPSAPAGSSLDKLLKAWGIQLESGKVVADMNFAKEITMQRGAPPQLMPAFLFLNASGINDDVVTSHLDSLWLPFVGAFTGTPAEGLTKTVLLHSSTNSQLVDGFMAQMSGEAIRKDFAPSGKKFDLAIRLTGKFKTAFPNGKPEEKKEDKPGEEKKDEPKPDAGAPGLKQSATEGAVVLVADADFVYDEVSVQALPFGKMFVPRNGNLTLIQNMAEQLAGDNNLIAVRTRATLNRPFIVVGEMQKQAEDRHREAMKKLEDRVQEAQRRLNELQSKKEGNQRFILSPEQQAELEKLKADERQAKLSLKEVRKRLREDIDSLETRLKLMNIAGMPIVVIIIGLSVAIVKRQRTRAK